MSDASIVDQHIDTAETLHRQRHRALHRLGVSDVAEQPQRLGVVMIGQVLHQAVQRGLLQIENHQARASLGQTHRQCATDAGTTSRDENHLAVEHLVGEYLAIHALLPLPWPRRHYNLLWLPSQQGGVAVCLQPQKNTRSARSAWYFCGVSPLPLWLPSHSGWLALCPQRHQK